MKKVLFTLAVITTAISVGSAAAEDLANVEAKAEIRVRYESLSNFDLAEESADVDNLVSQRALIGLDAEPKDGLTARLSVLQGFTWGDNIETASPTDIPPSHAETIEASPGMALHEGWFEVEQPAGLPIDLRVGRQEILVGSGRLIAANDWSNHPNAFDAVKIAAGIGFVDIDFYYSRLPDNKGLTIGVLGFDFADSIGLTADIHGLYRRQPNEGGTGAAESLYTTGAFFDWSIGDSGVFLRGEGDFQFGTRDENLPTEKEVNSLAYFAEAGWELDLGAIDPFIGAEYSFALGDEGTDMYKGFDPLYPNTGIYYGQMGIVGWSNIQSIRGRLGLDFFGRILVYADFYNFALHNTSDYWYIDGGSTYNDAYLNGEAVLSPEAAQLADAPTDLGNELDVAMEIRANDYFDFAAAWCTFMPGGYISETLKNVYNLNADNLGYVYIQGRAHF